VDNPFAPTPIEVLSEKMAAVLLEAGLMNQGDALAGRVITVDLAELAIHQAGQIKELTQILEQVKAALDEIHPGWTYGGHYECSWRCTHED